MKPILIAEVSPRAWPAHEMQDVQIHLTIRQEGSAVLEMFPETIALNWRSSVSSLGMVWDLSFVGAEPGAKAQGVELRTYYGPPGGPVSEEWLKSTRLRLKPGAEWATSLSGCWIPRELLTEANLDPKTLDPDGYDNVARADKKAPRPFGRPPALAEIMDLSLASVLVFNTTAKELRLAMAKSPDFLRGHIVVFFSRPGPYSFHAAYRQSPDMFAFVQKFSVDAEPVSVSLGAK